MSRRWPLILTLVAFAALVATGCAEDAPLDTLEPKGFFSEKIDGLFNMVFLVATVVFVLVQAGILFIAAKFRHKGEYKDDEFPEQVHGIFALEIGWTILPAIVLAVITVPTLATLFTLTDEPEGDFNDCITVYGQQWWWSYDYDVGCDGADGDAPDIRTATELVIPAGEQIQLRIASRDVIHSFWIPALNGKRDAVPNRNTPWNIHANDPGVYLGQCTEFCGLSHGVMRMHVKAVSPGDYDTWKADQMAPAAMPTDEAAVRGRDAFLAQCASCHTVREEGGTGNASATYDDVLASRAESPVPLVSGMAPDLTHFASREWFIAGLEPLYEDVDGDGLGERDRFNRVALEQWLRDPASFKEMAPDPKEIPGSEIPLGRGMPNLNLSEQTIDDVVEYLRTLE